MNGQPRSSHGTDDRGMDAKIPVNPPQARFGRMFDLPARPDVKPFPQDLGMPDGPMDGADVHRDNSEIPAIMTYFGQFVDHDLTLDTTSSLERQNDPVATKNFRTPMLELDSLYGLGPAVSPFLYDQRPTHAMKMLLGAASNDPAEVDLPRNSQGVALIGDPRNDENLIVAQLHVAFLKFHNAIVDQLPRLQDGIDDDPTPFEKVQRLVRWHYQWLIFKHFLPSIAGQDVVDAVRTGGRKFYRPSQDPFIPVEFSVAAYRFGHSMVQPGYHINDGFRARLFPQEPGTPPAPPGQQSRDLRGGPIRFDERVNWKNFVNTGVPPSPNATIQSSLIDTKLAGSLLQLPHTVVPPHIPPEQRSLAVRNLRRGVTMGLPSGQAIAGLVAPQIGARVLDDAELWAGTDFAGQPAPFWYYVLREAEVLQAPGVRLGAVGARLVVEVILGLMELDPRSFLARASHWTPIVEGRSNAADFTFVDLFRIAGTDIA